MGLGALTQLHSWAFPKTAAAEVGGSAVGLRHLTNQARNKQSWKIPPPASANASEVEPPTHSKPGREEQTGWPRFPLARLKHHSHEDYRGQANGVWADHALIACVPSQSLLETSLPMRLDIGFSGLRNAATKSLNGSTVVGFEPARRRPASPESRVGHSSPHGLAAALELASRLA